MEQTKSDKPTTATPATISEVVANPEPVSAPNPQLSPEIRQIVERNWKRDEEALRYLGR